MELISFLVRKTISLIWVTLFLVWWKPVKVIVDFHVALFWNFLDLLSLPARILTALQREKFLGIQLQKMEIELERFVWENKELKQRLHRVIKDRKVIEALLEEIEEDHEKALSRIDLLENELHDLKEESLRLNEVLGKSTCDYKDYKLRDNKRDKITESTPFLGSYEVTPWSTGEKGTEMIVEDFGDSWDGGDKSKARELSSLKTQPVPYPFTPQRNPIVETASEQRRVVALYRSLFSSILSLLVAMIIWEADDPCMPLVAALFTVVGLSMGSVVQFFSTIKNKPASDAVALLSMNWFILGTLTSPSLPTVARMLAPRVVRFTDRVIIWLGLSR